MSENLILQTVDGISFRMKQPYDFSFLKRFGRVFKVYDDQDSGNICFGLDDGTRRYFLKFAGAQTARCADTYENAVARLKSTAQLYKDLAHENLIHLVLAEEMGGGYGMLFDWVEGFCMARMYPEENERFFRLPVESRMNVFRDLLRFHIHAAEKGYAAVDFYDGSVLYVPEKDGAVVCDIDLYCKAPFVNEMGRMWGSSLFMSPEEHTLGAEINQRTNVYTFGAMAFAIFGRYQRTQDAWQLSPEHFALAQKAISEDPAERFQTLQEFHDAWFSLR